MITVFPTLTAVARDGTMEKYLNFKSHYKKHVLCVFKLVLPDRTSGLSYHNVSYVHSEWIMNNYMVQAFKINVFIFLS